MIQNRMIGLLTKRIYFLTSELRPRRVALMLDLEWPYKRHAGVFAGTQQYAQEQGWESTVDEYAYNTLPERESSSVRYDGIIARATKPLAERAARIRVPVVNTWASSPVRDILPGVFPDSEAAGRLRAEHLLSRGLRHFGALGGRGDLSHSLETREFRRVLHEAGYDCTMAHISLSFAKTLATWQKTEQSLVGWMDQWQLPIGVFVASESVGRIVVQMCRERGWRVPEDVAIIAGMNEEVFCANPRPSLSSVELGFERIGYEAARFLDRLMDEKEQGQEQRQGATPEHILLPPQGLVVRESTDFYAVDDQLLASALEFISANCHRDIGPADVAMAVSLEPRTLHRRFLKVLDRSVAAEIRRVRIERAKRELTQSALSITAIARNVGFGERMRMYDVFRRELGVTPSEYRKRRQVEDAS
jgi:LacI family transcriptional regulator